MALGLGSLSLSAESLWSQEVSRPMFADKRAVNVGDILTILVQETSTASKDKNTKTSKSSAMDAKVETFFYGGAANAILSKAGEMPALKLRSNNSFEGGGAINNSEKIAARVAVRVVDVLPNGNLVIEGSRKTAFSGEEQTFVLRGTVRPQDVAANNTVFSYNVADASLSFVGKGPLTDAQRKGWFNKVWDKVTPF